MIYKEFKENIEELGFEYHVLITMISVNNFLKSVCTVGINERYNFHIYDSFYNLDESLQKKVFELAVELAKTPLDERGELE